MKYSFIKDHEDKYRIVNMCRALQVSRGGYYNWLKNRQKGKKRSDTILLLHIRRIWEANNMNYGYRRVHKALAKEGFCYNKKKIARIMRENHLYARTRKKYKVTTNSNHSKPIAPILLPQGYRATRLNQAWVSDITYIRTHKGWLYLCTVIDLYSRKVVGWSMQKTMASKLVVDAFLSAVKTRKPKRGLIFHSDQGSQYASLIFRKLLNKFGVIQSMSRKGNCWDNAVAESFFKTLKTECVYWENYSNRQEAKSSIFHYIETNYNKRRIHSAINYLSPNDYENLYFNTNVA